MQNIQNMQKNAGFAEIRRDFILSKGLRKGGLTLVVTIAVLTDKSINLSPLA